MTPTHAEVKQGSLCSRIMLIIPEDWFALSHFRNVLSGLSLWAQDVVVVTRSSGRFGELEALGVRMRTLHMRRGTLDPTVWAKGRTELARLIDGERPDVIHAVTLQGMATTSFALERAAHPPSAVLFHLTGLGLLGTSGSWSASLVRPVVLRAIRRTVQEYGAWLLAENPDDITFMIQSGSAIVERTAIIPGAGIDAGFYSQQAAPSNDKPRAAFVGRMLRSKGVEVVVEAHRRLRQRGVEIELDLYGATDPDSRQAIPSEKLVEWGARPGVTWHGRVSDIVGVWRGADIAVFPSFGGEGMPRAMLEAASCARPLIVSDVPGCRTFVRPGVDGLVVRARDPELLSESLAYLASNPSVRLEMGIAARQNVIANYTESAVSAAMFAVYRRALAGHLR